MNKNRNNFFDKIKKPRFFLTFGIVLAITFASLLTITFKSGFLSQRKQNDETIEPQTSIAGFYQGIRAPIGTTFYISNSSAGVYFLTPNAGIDWRLKWMPDNSSKTLWFARQSSANNDYLELVDYYNNNQVLCRVNSTGAINLTHPTSNYCGEAQNTNYSTLWQTSDEYNSGGPNTQSFSMGFNYPITIRLRTSNISSGVFATTVDAGANNQPNVLFNAWVVITASSITKVGFSFLEFSVTYNRFNIPGSTTPWTLYYSVNTGNPAPIANMNPNAGTYTIMIGVTAQQAEQTLYIKGISPNSSNLFSLNFTTGWIDSVSFAFDDTNLLFTFRVRNSLANPPIADLRYAVVASTWQPGNAATFLAFNPPISGYNNIVTTSLAKPTTNGTYKIALTHNNVYSSFLNNCIMTTNFTFTNSVIGQISASNVTFTKSTISYNYTKNNGSSVIFQKLNTNAYTPITPTNQNGANTLNISWPSEANATNNYRLNTVASDTGAQLLTLQMPEVTITTPTVVNVNTIRLIFTWNQRGSTLAANTLRWNMYLADQTPAANGWQQFATPPVSGTQATYDLPAPTVNGTYRIAIAYQQDLTDFRFSQTFNFTLIPGTISAFRTTGNGFKTATFGYTYTQNGTSIPLNPWYRVEETLSRNEVIGWTQAPAGVAGANNTFTIANENLTLANAANDYTIFFNNTASPTGQLSTTFSVSNIELNSIDSVNSNITTINFTYNQPNTLTPNMSSVRWILYKGDILPPPNDWLPNTLPGLASGVAYELKFPTPTEGGEWKIAFRFTGSEFDFSNIYSFDLYERVEDLNTIINIVKTTDRVVEYNVITSNDSAAATNWKIELYDENGVLVPGSRRDQLSGTFSGAYLNDIIQPSTSYELRVSCNFRPTELSSLEIFEVSEDIDTENRVFIKGEMENGTANGIGNRSVSVKIDIVWNDSKGNLNWSSSLSSNNWYYLPLTPPLDLTVLTTYIFIINGLPIGVQDLQFWMPFGNVLYTIPNVIVT